MLIADERLVEASDGEKCLPKERCPKCGKRGFYMAIGMFWGFRCDHCGHKAGNYESYLERG